MIRKSIPGGFSGIAVRFSAARLPMEESRSSGVAELPCPVVRGI